MGGDGVRDSCSVARRTDAVLSNGQAAATTRARPSCLPSTFTASAHFSSWPPNLEPIPRFCRPKARTRAARSLCPTSNWLDGPCQMATSIQQMYGRALLVAPVHPVTEWTEATGCQRPTSHCMDVDRLGRAVLGAGVFG